jgi:AcrR family transcriptional regulator
MTTGHDNYVMITSNRKTRALERRETDILAAALELFSGDEWESVTVAHIAERAEIGKGTVYKHFASKDEIYARLALDFFYGLLGRCKQCPVRDDPAAEMRESFRAALRYHERHQEYRNVRQYVFRAGFWNRLNPSYIEAFEKLDAEFRAWANERIEHGIHAGIFNPPSLMIVRAGLDALFNGAVDQLWGNRCWMEIQADAYIEQVVEFAMSALSGSRETKR